MPDFLTMKQMQQSFPVLYEQRKIFDKREDLNKSLGWDPRTLDRNLPTQY